MNSFHNKYHWAKKMWCCVGLAFDVKCKTSWEPE